MKDIKIIIEGREKPSTKIGMDNYVIANMRIHKIRGEYSHQLFSGPPPSSIGPDPRTYFFGGVSDRNAPDLIREVCRTPGIKRISLELKTAPRRVEGHRGLVPKPEIIASYTEEERVGRKFFDPSKKMSYEVNGHETQENRKKSERLLKVVYNDGARDTIKVKDHLQDLKLEGV